MKLPAPLSFNWDEGNSEKNWKKHNVSNKETEEVFLNRPLITFPDVRHSLIEKRFQALGVSDKLRKLTIFFAIRKEKIRIISARDQNKKERKKYVEKKN